MDGTARQTRAMRRNPWLISEIVEWGDGCEGSDQAPQRRAPATQHARRYRGVSADTPKSHDNSRKQN